LGLILDQRVADKADLPGGAIGMLCRDYQGSASGVSATISVVLVGHVDVVFDQLGKMCNFEQTKRMLTC
jgi:hypothetical protein